MNFIKVLNPEKASLLIVSGFKYIKENFDGKTIYVFEINDELLKVVHNSFAKNDYFFDKTMNF